MLWLRWCSSTYGIPNVDPHMFGFNGKALCVLTKSMFRYRIPKGRGALLLYKVHFTCQLDVLNFYIYHLKTSSVGFFLDYRVNI